jgi:hypothetical protein
MSYKIDEIEGIGPAYAEKLLNQELKVLMIYSSCVVTLKDVKRLVI